MTAIRKLVPCLWFSDQAEEAAKFYVSVFERSRLGRASRYTEEGREIHGRPAGSVLTVEFEIEGHPFTALNGGPLFTFSPAISFQVMCETQAEIDRYWSALTTGGDEKAQQCGWLADKFGVSWQIVPSIMPELMGSTDPVKVARTMRALFQMKKLDIARLKQAHAGA
ncbi:MAG TPA: VOC family protein [Polyangiaceae bacterium]|jgi:predicted 3-demethylubiquinone-9 3-methyltransferase (glyoxalase superfamily)